MTAEPTQKPWEVVEFSEPLHNLLGARFVIRALGAPGGIALILGGLGVEEERANAHLIAAAHEMLDTLVTIADFAVGHGDVCEIIARRARLAIHKAEGQEAPE